MGGASPGGETGKCRDAPSALCDLTIQTLSPGSHAPERTQQRGHSQRDLLHAGLAQGPSVCARSHVSLRVL